MAVFLWLALQVSHDATNGFDAAVRAAVHSRAFPKLTTAMRTVTLLGSEWCLVPVGALLVWQLVINGRRRAAVQLAVASLGAESLNQALKVTYHRIRPEAFFDYARPNNYSFPSGHAIVSACFYGMLAIILAEGMRRRGARIATRVAAAFLVFLIGLSRVYLGVHHPTDVLAGYTLGIVWLSVIRAASSANRRGASPA